MNLTYGEFKKILKKLLDEANVSVSAGAYQTPKAFNVKKNKNTSVKHE